MANQNYNNSIMSLNNIDEISPFSKLRWLEQFGELSKYKLTSWGISQ